MSEEFLKKVNQALEMQYAFIRDLNNPSKGFDHYGMIPHKYDSSRTEQQITLDVLSNILTNAKSNICTAVCIDLNGKLLVANNDYGYAFSILGNLSRDNYPACKKLIHDNILENLEKKKEEVRDDMKNTIELILQDRSREQNIIQQLNDKERKNVEKFLAPMKDLEKVKAYMNTDVEDKGLKASVQRFLSETREIDKIDEEDLKIARDKSRKILYSN